MTTKTLKQPFVEFFATSSRLAQAYRSAAKRNKNLARYATIRDLSHARAILAKNADANQMVVLSHADDELPVRTDSLMEPVVSGAFHLLFTEPTTHPDQVAHWMRVTKIRAENRLHVVRVENMEAPQIADLLGRICLALRPDMERGSIIDAYLAGEALLVRGPKHRLLHVPVESVPALRGQPRAVLQNFRIDPDGSFIHWPELDLHLGWNQFLQATDPAELRKAQQRSADFNRRYGAAIRGLREAAGIAQAKVAGLTDRQLRRVEQGQCRATTNALAALARAHGLDVNTYMDRLAKAMG